MVRFFRAANGIGAASESATGLAEGGNGGAGLGAMGAHMTDRVARQIGPATSPTARFG